MPYTVKFEHPHFPEDYEFAVSGLGLIPNGCTLEVDADMEHLFVASRGMTIEDAFKDSPEVTLSGSTALSSDVIAQLVPPPVQEVEETVPAPVVEKPAPVIENEAPALNESEVTT